MALTLRKLLQLHHLQELNCIAGQNGIDRIVTSTGILDYEPILEVDGDQNAGFGPNCLVLSSLLFARNNPEMILPAIINLNEVENVAAFAFKDILIDQLPQEVLDYADAHNFPIFQFSDTWFENIIFSVMDAIQLENDEVLSEKLIHDMIQMNLQRNQIHSIVSNLSVSFRENICAYYIQIGKVTPNSNVENIFKGSYLKKELQQNCLIANYKNGYFLIITGNSLDPASYTNFLSKLIPYKENDLPSGWYIGRSEVQTAKNSLDICLRQAYFAYYGCQVLNKQFTSYSDLGTLKFLIPLSNLHEVEDYRANTINLLNQEKDLLETAEKFVEERGNINSTASACYCHPNTIRYRLKRIKQILGLALDGDYEVFEELSTCFKLEKINQISSNYSL